jgi:glycosyltransferase involved in cell wall biosynthesis
MTIPEISFVVPCYNYGRYLPDCLNSILSQEGEFDFEVIVIDDASTDNTLKVIHSYSDSRIRLIRHEKNVGHIGTINEGLRAARGVFVARIDPDDRYRSCFLLRTIEKLKKHQEVGMIYGDVALINDCGEITVERSDDVHEGQDYKGNELVKLMGRNFICAPSVIARREAWLDALPVPEGLAFNDWYFTLMMARKYEFYFLSEVLAEYRVHNSNHHSQIVKNMTEEPSIFRLLDRLYEDEEENKELERQKKRARRQIYSAQYLDMANKYFGYGHETDARRCYLAAIRHQSHLLLRGEVMRRVFGTFIGLDRYEKTKSAIKALLHWRIPTGS